MLLKGMLILRFPQSVCGHTEDLLFSFRKQLHKDFASSATCATSLGKMLRTSSDLLVLGIYWFHSILFLSRKKRGLNSYRFLQARSIYSEGTFMKLLKY